jgi:hypothetical protein
VAAPLKAKHNGKILRDHWIELWKREATVDYFAFKPFEVGIP